MTTILSVIMMFIITKLWPAFVPLIIYSVWLLYARARHQKVKWGDGPIKNVIYSSIALVLLCFLYLFFTIQDNGEIYVPTRVENGNLMPSEIQN